MSENDPVAPGHWLTLRTSVLLIWMYTIAHSITSAELADLLTLINLHLIMANPVFNICIVSRIYFQLQSLKVKS